MNIRNDVLTSSSDKDCNINFDEPGVTKTRLPSRDLLDWEAAAWWAGLLTPTGPTVTRNQAHQLISTLREAAEAAPGLVAQITGLDDASERAGGFPRLVVDRPTWAKANVEMFADLTAGHLPPATNQAAALTAAIELGGILGLLSTKVLGQFDPFSSRLYLVAPNIIDVRRKLEVDEEDFAAWVCLHEQTHAVQFAAAPWLAEHLRGELAVLLDSMADDPNERAWRALRKLPAALRPKRLREEAEDRSVGILTHAVLTAEEAEHLRRVVAVMSMLEGHADVVMDSASKNIPSTGRIRKQFTHRRESPRFGEYLLRKVLGLDAKLNQYRDGAKFVRGVVKSVGHEGFNQVFARAEHPAEIDDPTLWVNRVI